MQKKINIRTTESDSKFKLINTGENEFLFIVRHSGKPLCIVRENYPL